MRSLTACAVCEGWIHGLPITAYGEAGAMWLQNVVLLALLYTFSRASIARPALSMFVVILVATPVALGQVCSRPRFGPCECRARRVRQ